VNLVKDPDVKILVLIALAAGIGGALWYFWDDIVPPTDEPVVVQPETVVEEVPAQNDPVHPLEPSEQSESFDGEFAPLPLLDESDGYFLQELTGLFGPELERVLVNEALIDKFVATVDNLPRGNVAEKIRPVGRLSGAFAVVAANNSGPYYLNTDNYQRYNFLVDLASKADLDAVTAMYRRNYPLLQESYVRLGYPDGYFNDRAVEVIDHLLATPEPREPIRLVRPHVLYEFADAELEGLSSGQKLLLRMGGENAARAKRVLRNLRTLIAP